MAYHRHHGVDVRIVRIFNTFGPRMQRRRRPRDPELLPPGDPRRAAHASSATARRRARSCYVDDLVEGIWRLLRSELRRPREHRQPGRDVAARDGARRSCALARQREPDRVRARCRPTTRRCAGPTSRSRSACSRLGAAGARSRRASRARATSSRRRSRRAGRHAMTDRLADPQLLHHRAHRPRQEHAGRSAARRDGHAHRAREARPVPRQDGSRARARHHDQGADRAHALPRRATASSTSST